METRAPASAKRRISVPARVAWLFHRVGGNSGSWS